jgi:hypothetical protein
LRTSAVDEIVTPLSEVMTSPVTSPAVAAAPPVMICVISAPVFVDVSWSPTPRNAVGPIWIVALDDLRFSIAFA